MAQDKDMAKYFGGQNPTYFVSIDPSTNLPYVKTVGKADRLFLYVSPKKNADGTLNYSLEPSVDTVIKKYAADIKSAGLTNSVWSALLAAGDVTKKDFATKSATAWFKGLAKYIGTYSVDQVTAANNGAAAFTPFTSWFKTAASATGTSGGPTTAKSTATNKSSYLSSQYEADNELNLFFQEQLGRNATPEERKAYLTVLNAEETKALSTRTTTSTSTSKPGTSTSTDTSSQSTKTVGPGGLNAADHTRIMSGIVAATIKGMSTEDLMKTNGSIAQGISTLQSYAADFGLHSYDANFAKGDLVDKLSSGSPINASLLDSEKMNIRTLAKQFYPNLAKLIDQGVKISSVASMYTKTMQSVLELPADSINWIDDPYISKALQNKGMDGASQGSDGSLNLNDFTIMLRNDSRWAKTQNAREEASGYANSILQSFGLA